MFVKNHLLLNRFVKRPPHLSPLALILVALFLILLSPYAPQACAQSLDRDSSVEAIIQLPHQTPSPTQDEAKPFELKVTETRFLPDAMYGRWSVTAKLTRTTIPGGVPQTTYNNWSLEQIDNRVFISNIDNGAKAGIDVDEVKDRTATFHHKVILPERNPLRVIFGRESSDRDFMIEQPTITVDGDRMIGKTIQRFYHVKNGEVEQVFTAEFLLHAERLTNGRVQMGRKANDIDFEIEEIQHEPDSEAPKSPETIDSALYSR